MAFAFANSTYPDRAANVTPSDAGNNQFKYLWVGGAGNLAVVTEGGDSVTFTGVTSNQWIWLRVNQVKATGTTATNIVGFN
jgi:hypothetical protein